MRKEKVLYTFTNKLESMSINMTAAIPADKKHQRFGKHYWDIDLDLDSNVTESQFVKGVNDKNYSPNLGTLQFNGVRVNLTEKEALRVIMTLKEGLEAQSKGYQLGLMMP